MFFKNTTYVFVEIVSNWRLDSLKSCLVSTVNQKEYRSFKPVSFTFTKVEWINSLTFSTNNCCFCKWIDWIICCFVKIFVICSNQSEPGFWIIYSWIKLFAITLDHRPLVNHSKNFYFTQTIVQQTIWPVVVKLSYFTYGRLIESSFCELWRAICYLIKKPKLVFASIKFQA